jgi:hypothetical protein
VHLNFLRWPLIVTVLLLSAAGGCQNVMVGVAPAGPGAATEADLTPWLSTSMPAQRTGCLMEMNVPSEEGSYETWGLAATDVALSVEVDIRACAGAAEDFRGKTVIIDGKMMYRGEHHLPLLVAGRIVPADEHGKPLPDSGHHVAYSPQLDPITGNRDPMTAFQSAGGRPSGLALTSSAN